MDLPQVQGRRPPLFRVTSAYFNRVLSVAERDPALAERFFRVSALQESPSELFRPSMALRAALAGRGSPPAATSPHPAA